MAVHLAVPDDEKSIVLELHMWAIMSTARPKTVTSCRFICLMFGDVHFLNPLTDLILTLLNSFRTVKATKLPSVSERVETRHAICDFIVC